MVNSLPLGPPAGRPPMSRRQIIGARVAGVLGLLLILVTSAVLGTAVVGTGGDADDFAPYVWRSGSRIFLNNSSDIDPADCTLTGATQTRSVHVSKRPYSIFKNFETNGVYVDRFEPGPIKVGCHFSASATTGPILWFLPIGATPLPFVVGLILVAYWHVQRGGRRTQIFFGSRRRPIRPE